MDINIYITLAAITCLIFYLWYRRHDPRLPPCPVTPLPVFGHLFYLSVPDPRKVFKRWRKKCGDIYSIYMGQSLVVVLNGYDVIKEALVKHADKFTDRPYVLYDAATGYPGKGVTFSSGDLWKEQREVTVSILRSLGMGTSSMSQKISEIAATNNELLADLNGRPTDIHNIIFTSVTNVVCSLLMFHTFKHDDEQFIEVCKSLQMNIEDADARNLANYFPWLLKFPGDFFKAKEIERRAKFVMYSFVEPFIKNKINQSVDELDSNDLISKYFFYSNKKRNAGQITSLDDVNLRRVIYDLFGAGIETTANTLMWGILYLLHYPDVQEKVYREIEKEIGTERPPTTSDNCRLPYLNSFIKELQRIVSVSPLSLTHLCTETTTLGGFKIPKGTQIIVSLDSVMYDKTIWGDDVYVFRPERFLDSNGKVKSPKEFIPFSIGKRACPGESLAIMEMYLLLSWMIQRFQFLPVDPRALPPLTVRFCMTANPFSFEVRVLERKHLQV